MSSRPPGTGPSRTRLFILALVTIGTMINYLDRSVLSVAAKSHIGVTAGVFNFCTNLAGIITPLVIGLIYMATGSFFFALAYIAVVALLGVLSYVFLLGDVKRVELA